MSESDPADLPGVTALTMLDLQRLSHAFIGLQGAMPHTVWPYLGQSIAAATKRLTTDIAGPVLDNYDTKLALLRSQGIAQLDRVLDPVQVGEIRRHLDACPCFAAHIAVKSDGAPRTLAECAARGPQASYRLADLLQAPHFLELANREDILALMEAYLGCVPSIYSINAFWTFPGGTGLIPGLQTYHRDFDDYRFCTLFLFLTDISPADGAHHYIRATHRPELVERQLKQTNPAGNTAAEVERLFAKLAVIDEAGLAAFRPQTEIVGGPAGTAVLEDTYGLHKGDVPKSNRLLAWIRYGLYQNQAHFTDKIQPIPRHLVAGRIPDTKRHRYINRLIVEP